MPVPPRPVPPSSDAELARYLARMAADCVRLMDGRPELRTLRYLFDMARLEAERQASGGKMPPPR